jgi:hypothetical protein
MNGPLAARVNQGLGRCRQTVLSDQIGKIRLRPSPLPTFGAVPLGVALQGQVTTLAAAK